jgi:hypothetical protein
MMEYLDILEKLHSDRCWVTFKKVSGDMRTMWCTLQKEHLPEQKNIEEVLVKPEDEPKSIAVWDLEKKGWRSFRIESMVRFEINSYLHQSDFSWSKS